MNIKVFKNILVVKLSSIGDTVHAVPAVRALKMSYPETKIWWCVEKKASSVVKVLNCVDRIIEVDTYKWRKLNGLFGKNNPLTIMKKLRSTRFDVAIDFQGLMKSAVLCLLSGAKTKIGWGKTYLREKSAHIFYNLKVNEIKSNSHVIDICSSLLIPLGIESVPWKFPYDIPESIEEKIKHIIKTKIPNPFIILNPGAGWPTKMWRPEKYAELGKKLQKRLTCSIVVTCGPGEELLVNKIVCLLPSAIPLRLNLTEFMSLASKALCFVGSDTGPMHIASAMGAPVVALFGPTDPIRNGPFGSDDISLSLELDCSSCYKRKCDHWSCMNFTVDHVLNAVLERIEKLNEEKS